VTDDIMGLSRFSDRTPKEFATLKVHNRAVVKESFGLVGVWLLVVLET